MTTPPSAAEMIDDFNKALQHEGYGLCMSADHHAPYSMADQLETRACLAADDLDWTASPTVDTSRLLLLLLLRHTYRTAHPNKQVQGMVRGALVPPSLTDPRLTAGWTGLGSVIPDRLRGHLVDAVWCAVRPDVWVEARCCR